MLELSLHPENAFVTLTYDEEHLPDDLCLDPEHLRNFLKRLRAKTKRKIRYYAVGEYGEQTFRPHFHLALFNYPSCLFHRTRAWRKVCCEVCEEIKTVWGNGKIETAPLDDKSAAYVAGYIVKKLTDDQDPRLEGRTPEFARMSLKPGIGAAMMDEVASTILSLDLHKSIEDVPTTLAHGKRHWPLGRYLRKELRKRIGRSEKAPESTIKKMEEELRPLREMAYRNAPPGSKDFAFKGLIQDLGAQKRLQLKTRERIFKPRKTKI